MIQHATDIFMEGVSAVLPDQLVKKNLYRDEQGLHIGKRLIPETEISRLILVAAGKAAPEMARMAEQQLGHLLSDGICITKYDHAIPLTKIPAIESAHPVPDENSILAGEKVLAAVKQLDKKDIVLVLISGGASSLLADIPEGCTLEETRNFFELLVNSGASIHEINTVRKHLSRIKGGQLTKVAYPARVFTLILSDVLGDNMDIIASGPTVPDRSTFAEAMDIVNKYQLKPHTPAAILNYLEKGVKKKIEETPKPGEYFFKHSYAEIIGNNRLALEAAKSKAGALGYTSVILSGAMNGNTVEESRMLVQQVIHYKGEIPACLLMGGETTLKVTGNGKGGRNQHFVLEAFSELQKREAENNFHVVILSGGTDGTDGPTDAAGAVADSKKIPREPAATEWLRKHLNDFNAYHYFEKAGGLLKTGPTQTNVMDLVVALINKKE